MKKYSNRNYTRTLINLTYHWNKFYIYLYLVKYLIKKKSNTEKTFIFQHAMQHLLCPTINKDSMINKSTVFVYCILCITTVCILTTVLVSALCLIVCVRTQSCERCWDLVKVTMEKGSWLLSSMAVTWSTSPSSTSRPCRKIRPR